MSFQAGLVRPVVSYNQAGYTPGRSKVALVELDPRYDAPKTRGVAPRPAGNYFAGVPGCIKPWGKWLRYQYASFDF